MDSKYEEIRAAVNALLERNGVAFSVVLLGKRTRDGWEHDAWYVTFSRLSGAGHSEDFNYCTGLGLRKPAPMPKHVRAMRPYSTERRNWERANPGTPVAPRAADVLHSLILDSSAVGQSFESWCDEFGYDADSRKAEATYRECQKNADKLARVLDRRAREELAELLQDY
jgi:hypothetical protein